MFWQSLSLGARGRSGGSVVRRARRLLVLVVLTAATLGLTVPGQASATFSWDTCEGANTWVLKQLTVTPDPIMGSGAALPFRWELTYDAATNAITKTEFAIGAPTDAASAIGLLLRYPVAGNVVGSATYAVTPSGLPVAAGNYGTPGVTADGVTAQWSLAVLRELNAAALGSVEVTLEKKVFGVWVEIPGVDIHSVQDLSFLTAGDYYMKTALRDPNNVALMCVGMYFTNGPGATAPFVLRAATLPFSGFFSPVDNRPTVNTVKGGSSVPVKFSLGGNLGLNVFAAGSPYSEKTSCSSGTGLDEIEQTATAGSSGLQYDAISDTYTYVWKTDRSWAKTCRTLHVKLSDGTDHAAMFRFR